MTSIVERLATWARAECPDLPAPLAEQDLEQAEQRLGFRLHPLLREVYSSIADGGFGAQDRLLPMLGEGGAVELYLAYRAQGEWGWPEGVLPILDWGCAMNACVDCRSDEGTVLLFDPNPGEFDFAWFVDSSSLASWFEAHVDSTGWWVRAEDGENFEDLPPWPHARERA